MTPDINFAALVIAVLCAGAVWGGFRNHDRVGRLERKTDQERAIRQVDNNAIHNELELQRLQIELLRARLNKKAVKALQAQVSLANIRASQQANTQPDKDTQT